MHIVILAGGGGTRLWPLSRQDFPKQFLQFGHHESLLQKSVKRALHSPLTESVVIVTSAQYEVLVRKQLEKIDPENRVHVLVEPARKNTAPAIAFAMKYIQETATEDATVLVLPSDHIIEPREVLSLYLEKMEPLIQNGSLILFGIKPTKAETGFGYIQRGKEHNSYTYAVERFVEKPDLPTAESYVKSGAYYWNTGMCAFSMRLFSKLLSMHAPEIASLFQSDLSTLQQQFDQMPNISFDYAVLEKCSGALVCPLPVQWSDIGSWDSVYEILEKDGDQNATLGNVFPVDTKNSLILGGKRLISTIGLENMLIVETEDAIFISKKGESQKVKSLVQELIKWGKIST